MKGFIITIVIIGGLLGLFFLLGSSSSVDQPATTQQSSDSSASNKPAIDFTLADYQGQKFSLADFQGKEVVVLNFWASWCPFCIDEMPDFAQVQEEFKDEIIIIAVNRSESLNRAKQFSDQVGVTDKLVLLLDPKDEMFKAYGAFAMPTTFFIKDGQIVDQKFGPMPRDEMRSKIENILNS